jgi:hypothetical protein
MKVVVKEFPTYSPVVLRIDATMQELSRLRKFGQWDKWKGCSLTSH